MNTETVGYNRETAGPAETFVNRGASKTRLIAGVSVPDGPLITAVIEHAQRLSEPYLFNHAIRSWLFAEVIGRIKKIDYDREVVAIGTILHDIGLTASVSGPKRFEVNGADAALSFIKGKGVSDRRAQLIWDTVALTRRHHWHFIRNRKWRSPRWASDSTTVVSALRQFRRPMSSASSALSPD
jgi:hypothetical protein